MRLAINLNFYNLLQKTNSKLVKKLVFSLIELSIVIIIIGILVVAVTSGGALIKIAKLIRARSLSNSSPVVVIENLTLWLETTSKKSFDKSEAINGAEVTTWYGTNPQSSFKINPTASTGKKPLYQAEGINGLPAILFDGLDDFMDTGMTFKRTAANGWTIFLVFEDVTQGGNNSDSRFGFIDGGIGSLNIRNYGLAIAPSFDVLNAPSLLVCFNCRDSFTETTMMTIINDPNANNSRVYGRGVLNQVSSFGATGASSKTISIGWATGDAIAGTEANTKFGEIIVYDRALPDLERSDVEAYLSKKWKIKKI